MEAEQTTELNLAIPVRSGVCINLILRKRLRVAALPGWISEPGKVLDIALDCGFGDVPNFNHAFRAEFGVSPTDYRKLYFAIL